MASKRPNNSFLLFLFAAALCLPLFASGCSGLYGYGEPVDRSGFVSAMASPDGTRGVFCYRRLVYRPAEGWRAFPDGGIPKYEADWFVVGIYDMKAGSYRLAEVRKNKLWAHGQGEPHVSQVSDGKAIINCGGQLASDLSFHSEHMLLDLDTAELVPLPIEDELSGRGLEPGYFYLVDGKGTMVVIALPVGASGGLRDWRSNESVSKELWLRHPDGTYEKAADAIHYYGFTGGLVHYFSSDERRYMVYDTVTGRRSPGDRYPPAQPEKTADLRVSSGRPGRLDVAVKGPDRWAVRDAGLDPDEFFD